MKNKAIFFDRDGTLIDEKNYLQDINDIKFKVGVFEALKKLQEKGYLLFIITNQSGVARGYFDIDTVKNINDYIEKILCEKGIKISKTYFCPHHPNGNIKEYSIDCNCRKPKTGMIDRAVRDFTIDLSKSYVIGDKDSDIELGSKIPLKTIYFKNDIYVNKNKNFIFESNEFDKIVDFISEG